MNITRRWLRDMWIVLRYRLEINERKKTDQIDVDYSLDKRWERKLEHQKSIAFAFATIENVSGERMLLVDELQVTNDQDKGKGLGSYLIRQIIKYADKRQLPVALFVDPGGVGGIRFNKEELTNWYARYEFVKEGGKLVRRP
jgi:hypothetical protein